jgi:hypothetical protein
MYAQGRAPLGSRNAAHEASALLGRANVYKFLAEEHQLTDSPEEHSRILDILTGDPELAGELIQRHLDHTTGIWAGREPGTEPLERRPKATQVRAGRPTNSSRSRAPSAPDLPVSRRPSP